MRITKNPEHIIYNIIKNKSVILVGNGPSILKIKNGKRIDSFDIVVRFNGYQLKPAYTGKKTLIHVQSEHSLFSNEFCTGAIPIVIPHQIRFLIGEVMKGYETMYKHINELQKLLPPKRFPTTGLIFIYTLKKMKIDFYITGFDGNVQSSTFESSHYYKSKKNVSSIGHGYNHTDENSILRRFEKKKFFKLL